MDFEIIAMPTGEEPEAVRAAWVGLVLHCDFEGPQKACAEGLVTGEPSADGEDVYIANASNAIASLEERNPQAAAWYRERWGKFTHNKITFNASACKEVLQ